MLKFRRVFALLALLTLLVSLSLTAFAGELDPDRTGSLKVRILESKTRDGVPGGLVEIYQVASVEAVPGGVGYVLTHDFVNSGFDVSIIGEMTASQNTQQAERLEAFVGRQRLESLDFGVPDKTGTVHFKDLSLGLYLVVQTKAASKHTSIAPFLITVPQRSGEDYIYEVDAAPKTGTSHTIPTTAPTRPHTGGLPQTGQLWWPVYLLSAVGIALFVMGMIRRKRASHE